LAAWLVYFSIRLVAATLRYRLTDRSGFYDHPPAGQAIYATWHNRLALCFTAYFSHARKHSRTSGLAVMVSASRAPETVALLIAIMGSSFVVTTSAAISADIPRMGGNPRTTLPFLPAARLAGPEAQKAIAKARRHVRHLQLKCA